MPIGPARMAFFDHLAELRRRLVVVVVVLFAASMGLYFIAPQLYLFLLKPVIATLPAGTSPKVWDPFEMFATRFQVAFFASVVVSSPVIAWQLLGFFLPALKPKERRWFVPIFAAVVILFIAGVVFCYTEVLGPGFAWLHSQGAGVISQEMRASTYLSGVMLFLLGFGLAFQTPVVVFALVYLEIVPYKKLRQNWRIAYVVLMLAASIGTPDWSPVTMGLLFGALVALYESSMLLSRLLLSKKIAAQKAEELA